MKKKELAQSFVEQWFLVQFARFLQQMTNPKILRQKQQLAILQKEKDRSGW